MSVSKIFPNVSTPVEKLLECADRYKDEASCIMVIVLKKDGNLMVETSAASIVEKSFMCSFAQAYNNYLFPLVDYK